ncbi:MAG TPA: tetratricopeptide repeat protein [Pyrinomonadaceae bacterium]
MKILILLLISGLTIGATQAQTTTRIRRTETTPSQNPPVPPAIDEKGNVDGDPIETLRAQIDAASMVQDRNHLQLKLAEELVKTGNKTDALKELFSVLNANGFDPVGFYNLGNAFARLGESQSAITAYRRAIEQRKGRYSRAQNNLGVVLLREGRWDEAYDAFMAALKLENFRYAEADYNLGRLYAARGQNDLAARAWRRSLLVDPQHTAARQALARGEDEPEIIVEKPAAVARSTSRESVKSVSSTTPKAAPAARGLRLTLDQVSFDYLQRARNAAERGKTLDAVENFRRVLNRQGGYFAPANLELSYAFLSLKRYDEALAQLIQVSKRDGARYPVSYFHLARLYELKGDLKAAETAFTEAVNAYGTNNSQPLLDLSRVREKQGNFKGALEAMERYVTLMQQQGLKPVWGDERLAELRAKVQ